MVNVQFTFENLEQFLLIFVRVASLIYAAPLFSQKGVPRQTKVGLSLFISIILFQVIPKESLAYSTVIEYAVLVIREAIAGLIIGFGAEICYSIIAFAGRIIDMEIGLSMVSMFDPSSNTQISITGAFYNYLFMLMFIISDMHHYIIRALVDTYELIPMGRVIFNMDKMYVSILQYMGDYLVIGFRIVLPVFAVTLVTNVVLGVLAKVAPQVNMFSVGLQIKICMGLVTIYLVMGLFGNISNYIFTEMKRVMISFIQGMY